MALYFDAQGSYYAKRETSLGTSTSDTTVMFLFRNTKSASNQGTIAGITFTGASSGNYNLVSNGTSLYLGVDTGYISNFGYLPSTSAWYIGAFRRTSSVNSGKWFGSVYNGSSWTSINGSSGAGSLNLTYLWSGFETGKDYLRDYCMNGLELAHLRVWANTYLSDSELVTESTSHEPVVSGITCAFTCVDDGTDSEGGDDLSLTATYPTFNSTDPAPAAGGETPEIVVPWAQRIVRHSGRFM